MANQKMQLADWLDDLCVRFIINLPQEEFESVSRICFQVEEAQWYYEDFIRPIDPTLPSLNLKQFCLRIFRHCPLLSAFSDEQHLAAYQEFLGYKTRVPVRGAIMLNFEMDKVVLVKGWKSNASWSFPRGKINKDEPDLDCAIREVYEETGYDIRDAGLAPVPEEVKAIDVTMREQHMRLFVFRGVPEDTAFEAKTRKEISKIDWYRLSDLPTIKKRQAGHTDGHENHNPSKFYMVAPFLGPLRKWINQQRKMDAHQALYEEGDLPSEAFVEEQPVADPAAELKRLLSVQPAQSMAGQPAAEQQANSLLQMLRGSQAVPHTPIEQMSSYPLQPPSPHAQHVRESPYATSQPPPVFSPQQTAPQIARFGGQQGGPHHANQLSANQQGLLRMMQQQPQAQQQQQPAQQQPQGSALLQAFFGPSGGQPLSQQAPAMPPISQVPQPKLNNHAMGLLSAFKAGPGAGKSSALLNAAKHAPLPKNPHQNTLLDLLRGPSTSAAPVSAPTVGLAETLDALVLDQAASGDVANTRPPPPVATTRKPSASSMINRTLPRAARKPSAPSMDADNFPTLGSAPPPKPKQPLAGSPQPVANLIMKPMTILARPEQPVATAQPHIQPETKNKLAPTPTPIAILQRPSSAARSSDGSAVAPHAQPRAPHVQPKPAFQPQILKRGETVPSPLEAPVSQQATEASSAAPTHGQRDTLLSLFAQAQAQPRTVSPDLASPDIASTSQSRFGSIGSRTGAPASMSRQGSMASPTGLQDGARSPETPQEKRGFLMDYLDNVVKGAK